MKVFWFGDSWAAGSELPYTTSNYRGQLKDRFLTHKSEDCLLPDFKKSAKRYRPDLAFPALITEQLNLDSYYYVQGGASANTFYSWLIDSIKDFEVKDSIAIFSLPTTWKRYEYINNDNVLCKNSLTENSELIYRVQLERGYYDTTILLNLLYHVCIANRITPYFFCCWQKVKTIESLNLIPKENFFFPLTTTLVDLSWESSVVGKVNPDIYPNEGHPNVEGQQKLARTLLPYVKNALLMK